MKLDLKSFVKQNLDFNRILLLVIAVGVWGIFIQNFIHNIRTQDVYVTNRVDAWVDNTVDVRVENEVEVDLQKVLGYPVGCRKSYSIDGREYQAIDVYDRSRW